MPPRGSCHHHHVLLLARRIQVSASPRPPPETHQPWQRAHHLAAEPRRRNETPIPQSHVVGFLQEVAREGAANAWRGDSLHEPYRNSRKETFHHPRLSPLLAHAPAPDALVAPDGRAAPATT